jgi:tetratricopeptide (TPR) repeat protein
MECDRGVAEPSEKGKTGQVIRATHCVFDTVKHMIRFLLHTILITALVGTSCSWLTLGKAKPKADAAPASSGTGRDTVATTPAHPAPEQNHQEAKQDTSEQNRAPAQTAGRDSILPSYSPATDLLLRACDNYLAVNPKSPKAADVLGLKAATFYNNKAYAKSRESYEQVLTRFPGNPAATDAMKMIAQSYYEEKQFDKAQEWYRKLRDKAPEGGDKTEAVSRIAESIYRIAEGLEQQQRYKDAAEQYERVALEFPEARIADISLFNAASCYEKEAQWSQAILQYQRLYQKYLSSELVPKAMFRSAKCFEKLSQWDQAAQTYLRVTAKFPRSDMAPAALYNAGFCFENAEKLVEAAAAFEKMVELFPASEDAADVLFKAGELYGKLKDWANVSRVNTEFARRFGNDTNRVVQAQCMIGIALYMQNKEAEALAQLNRTLAVFNRIPRPSAVNKYYAAKTQYTIGEIYQTQMNRIELIQPAAVYKKNLAEKSDLLDRAVSNYSEVVKFGISEWTTRGIFQAGLSNEDFARSVFKQERPAGLPLDKQLALELGIAKAMEEYLINKALHYYEQNVKLGIKEKLDDKYVVESRTKVVFLPYSMGKNYLLLVDIAKSSEQSDALDGFALVARELETLQKIAPFQERAIELFLTCLEKGSLYQEFNEYFKQASSLITGISFKVGETYSDVSIIAREAPVPESFDPYEKFVYKTKLLQQIEVYEEQALKNYLRTVKISVAYKIEDEFVGKAKERIPQVLFLRGRCYDLLGSQLFTNPPFPAGINEAEKEQYKARFEEVGMKFQDQSMEVYRNVLEYVEKGFAAGEFVTYAYVRLFQTKPKDYGFKQGTIAPKIFTSGPQWKCLADSTPCWAQIECDDNMWFKVHKGKVGNLSISGFPAEAPVPMWFGQGNPKDTANYMPFGRLFFRYVFYSKEEIHQADLYIFAVDEYEVYLNGTLLPLDTGAALPANSAVKWNISGKIRDGKNVIAVRVMNMTGRAWAFMPYAKLMVTQDEFLPRPPGFEHPFELKDVADGTYQFPFIKNFSPEDGNAQAEPAPGNPKQ